LLTGVILAGGQNRRMGGRLKALLPFLNQTLIERQITTMKEICSEIIVVANDPKPLLPLLDRSVRMITDFYPGQGPLSGMHAALSLAKQEHSWIVACGMPFLSANAAQFMWDRLQQRSDLEAVIPFFGGKYHPLHGIYRKHCSLKIGECLRNGKKRVGDFLMDIQLETWDELDFHKQGIAPDFVANINTPEQYEETLRKMEGL